MSGEGKDRREIVTIDHDGVVRENPDAKLFATAEGERWIPKSELVDEDDSTFGIPLWLAEDRELV